MSTETISLTVNGAERQVPEGTTIADLLRECGIDPARTAVERNEAIVAREQHGSAVLAAGDRLEVVTLVGGG